MFGCCDIHLFASKSLKMFITLKRITIGIMKFQMRCECKMEKDEKMFFGALEWKHTQTHTQAFYVRKDELIHIQMLICFGRINGNNFLTKIINIHTYQQFSAQRQTSTTKCVSLFRE